MFLRDHIRRHVCQCDAVELRIHGDEIDRARFVHLDVTQVAVGFAADHIRQS